MGRISDIYSELRLDLSGYDSGISRAIAGATSLGSALGRALGGSFRNDVQDTSRALEELGNTGRRTGRDISKIVTGIMVSQGFYKIANAVQSAAGEVYEFQKATDTAAIAFKHLLGSADQANIFTKSIEKFAAETPFELDNIRDYSRKLLAAGMSAKQVIPTMTTLGDAVAVAGGGDETLDRIVDVMVKIKAQGRITAREVNRIAQSGIEIYPILRDELGLTAEQIAELGKEGIDADRAIGAILSGWNKRFGGASAEISKTMDGIISNIKDNFVLIMSDVFKGPYEAIRGFMEKVGNAFSHMREIVSSSGAGGLLEALVPPDLQDKVRVVIIEIMQLGAIIRDIGIIAAQGFRPLLDILYMLEPVIAAVANVIHWVAQAAANGSVWVRVLVGSIAGLFIANKVITLLLNFRKVIMSLKVVTTIAGFVAKLAGTFQLLAAAVLTNPIAAGIALIAGALLAIVVSSDKASLALDGIMERLAKLFGVDIGKMLQPQDTTDALAGLDDIGKNSGLGDVGKDLSDIGDAGKKAGKGGKKAGKGLDDAGKSADKANKKVQDLLFSFDEVYRIPDDLDKAAAAGKKDKGGDGDGDGSGGAGGLGDGLFGKGGKAKAERAGKDLGESVRDQFAKMPPIMLPGFQWPPFPPLPEIAFEPVFVPVVEWMQVRIPRAIDDFVTYLQTVPARVQEAWEPVGEALKSPLLDFPLVTIPIISTWTQESLGILKQWGIDAQEALNGFVEPTALTLREWATQGIGSIQSFTVPTKENILTWATETAATLKSWAPSVMPSIDSLRLLGTVSVLQFLSQTSTQISSWAPSTAATFSGWALTTGNLFNSWTRDTVTKIKNWDVSSNGIFSGWNVSVGATVNSWAASTARSVSNWATETKNGVSTWNSEEQTIFQRFKTEAGQKIREFTSSTATQMDPHHGMSPSVAAAGGTTRDIKDVFKFMGLGIIGTLAAATIPGIVGAIGGSAPVAALTGAAATFFTPITTFAKDKTESARKEVATLPDRIGRLKDSMYDAARRMAQGFQDAWKSAVSTVGDWLSKLTSGGSSNMNASISVSGGPMNRLATGGMVSKNQFIEIGENNKRETVVPLQNKQAMAPVYDYIDESVQRAFGSAGSSSGSDMRPLYVGTLIADERGIKELHRKFQVLDLEEEERRGF